MLRQRSHRVARSRVAGWLVLSVLYLVAVVLNVLLALGTRQVWPFGLAGLLGAASAGCAVAAVRDRRN